MYMLGSLLILCSATLCPAQSASGSSTATSPGGTPPAQSAKTPAAAPAQKTQKKTSSQDKKKTDDKKTDQQKKTDEQRTAGGEEKTGEKPKAASSEVKCAAFYFQNEKSKNNPASEDKPARENNPAPANLSEMQKYCKDDSNPQQQARNIPNVGLGNEFFLWVTRNQGKITGENGEIAISDLRLFLNEVEVDDSNCRLVAADDANAIVGVRLERPPSSKAAWNRILANGGLGLHLVRVTLGASKKTPLPSHAMLGLKLMQWKWYFWLLPIILFILVLVLLKTSRFKRFMNMLRDSGPVKDADGNIQENGIAAYSLARVQMAYWFALSILAYVLIWGITGDRDTINNDILVLIGISAGTFLGAVSIDSSKKSQAQDQLPGAAAKLVQMQSVVQAVTPMNERAETADNPTGKATVKLAMQAVGVQKDAVNRLNCQAMVPQHKGSFWADILSDANGISFHRFQIVAWSLVLGVIFVHAVFTTLSMPTFGNTMLGLMGISGGTYLGFKFPEQKTS